MNLEGQCSSRVVLESGVAGALGSHGFGKGRTHIRCEALGRSSLTAWVAAALQRFSESTLEYLANLDQAPDPTVRKDTFAFDISSAYDTLFHHWLQSREAKVCLTFLAALSHPELAHNRPLLLFWGEGMELSVYTCLHPSALRLEGGVLVRK